MSEVVYLSDSQIDIGNWQSAHDEAIDKKRLEYVFKYIDIEVDTYKYLKNENGKDKKTKVGYKICRFAQFPDGKKAILPSVLSELLQSRKDT